MTARRAEIAGNRWPRGLRREDAAAYLGISPSKFDGCLSRGLIPGPKMLDGVKVWDRVRLDQAFESLPDEAQEQTDSWAHLNGGVKVAVR